MKALAQQQQSQSGNCSQVGVSHHFHPLTLFVSIKGKFSFQTDDENLWHVVRSKTIPQISANFSPILFHFLVDYKTITPTCHAFYYQEKISVAQNLANSIPLFIFAILLFFLVSNSILLLSFDCSVDSVWSSIVKVSFRWHFYVQKH